MQHGKTHQAEGAQRTGALVITAETVRKVRQRKVIAVQTEA